ncbi:MAG TPA: PEGA domain-containing protein [Blastocatellia bacterium]|nr:PEGA domain-containing protein [Blastocatellia bacterium]
MKIAVRGFFAAVLCIALNVVIACTRPPASPNQNSAPDPGAATSTGQQTADVPRAAIVESGTIEVTSTPPGATIMLIEEDASGPPRPRGSTPAMLSGITPGKYTVHLEKTGFRYFQKKIEVKAGETAKVAANLKKE